MKLSFALAAAGLSLASAKKTKSINVKGNSIKADSQLGSKILSKARKLEQEEEEEVDFTWVANYSLKFQGCHHMQQWNDEADGQDEPYIMTKRLVRFRLCPSDSCTIEDAGGCDSGYGDYIIDMNEFVEAYWQNKMQLQEIDCQNNCQDDCENADNKEYCEYDCFADLGMDYCNDKNPYEDDAAEEEEEFNVEEYLECGAFDIPEEERRKLEDEEEIEYFLGPYCSDQGGKIYLGVFTDEACTNFANNEDGTFSHLDFYKSVTGKSLPYSEETLIDSSCVTCLEPQDNDDDQDEDEVTEMCEMLYQDSGKCESSLGVKYPNENACTYMEGIKIIRKDGTISTLGGKSATMAALIGVFAISSVLLGVYVYYLKAKLDRAKINLSE